MPKKRKPHDERLSLRGSLPVTFFTNLGAGAGVNQNAGEEPSGANRG
jgi:hypothetical protein